MTQLSVVTWNVHGFVDERGRPRRHDVIALLAHLDADVIALQEAPRADTDEVARALGRHLLYAPASWMGCALLARSPWQDAHQTTLLAGGEARSAAWGTVDVDGAVVGVAVTHLDHRAERVRLAEAEQLLARLPSSVECLVGDLNAVNLDDLPAARRAALDRERAFRRWEPLAGAVLERFASAGFHDVVGPRLVDRALVSTSRADIRIDHVLARGDHLRTRAVDVVDSDASDHRPVHVVFTASVAEKQV
jgi:endonuclease/exonuclease/phosphatase family metal-dependent hydrolase